MAILSETKEKKTMNLILIFSDRDGTINVDKHYYLGSAKNWREQIEILPTVAEGIRILNKIPTSKFVTVTSQSGIALGGDEFKDLTPERLEEVNRAVAGKLEASGARVDAWFSCGYVTRAYAEKAKAKGREILAEFVNDDAPCIKPRTGMMEDAARKFGATLLTIKRKFMIGDILSDIQMGINGGCELSILVPSFQTQELGDLEKVMMLGRENPAVLIAENFLKAAEEIARRCA